MKKLTALFVWFFHILSLKCHNIYNKNYFSENKAILRSLMLIIYFTLRQIYFIILLLTV